MRNFFGHKALFRASEKLFSTLTISDLRFNFPGYANSVPLAKARASPVAVEAAAGAVAEAAAAGAAVAQAVVRVAVVAVVAAVSVQELHEIQQRRLEFHRARRRSYV